MFKIKTYPRPLFKHNTQPFSHVIVGDFEKWISALCGAAIRKSEGEYIYDQYVEICSRCEKAERTDESV